MKRRSLILMILIVLLPVGLLTWLSLRMAKDERSITEQRFRSVMEQRLDDVNRVIAGRFLESEQQLQQITSVDNFSVADLRAVVRSEPRVSQLFVLSPDGGLLYPNPGDALNGTELSFLQRAARMFTDRDLQNAVAQAEAGASGDFAPLAVSSSADPLVANSSVEGISSLDENNARLMAQADLPGAAPIDVPALSRRPSVSLPQQEAVAVPSNVPSSARSMAAKAEASLEMLRDAPAGDKPTERIANVELGIEQKSDQLAGEPQQRADAVDKKIFGREISAPPASAAWSYDREINQQKSGFLPSSGWFVWYWDRGLNLIYWQRRPSGHIVGAALERSRWIADLISWLPESEGSVSGQRTVAVSTSFRVLSSSAESVYEWGSDIPKQAVPFCECPLAAPLASWRVQCFVPADQIAAGGGRGAMLGFAAGMGAFTLMLTAMAWLLYRDYSRDMREASQQVSFVNQVSHELKTPLTNIRLYADLLERDLEQVSSELTERPLRRLEIINSEAQRLSRLIGNVLTFAQQHRKTLQIQPVEVDLTGLVRQIAERFTPSLANHGIEVTVEGPGGCLLWLDPDFVEQILGNLLSNVEKYAATGRQLTIRTALTRQDAIIDVRDAGPGIAKAQRASLFLPFSRLSKDLRASTGTGIGLSITRELARLHGGDVILKESVSGCWFQVHLKSQKDSSENRA